MANKWQICIDVTEDEFKLLLIGLEALTLERIAEGLPAANKAIDDLRGQIKLSWIEKEIEVIPPPSKWSKHSSVAFDRSTNPL